MARSYSPQFLQQLETNTSDGLGVELAKLCTKANLPAAYIAAALHTSRVTVYGWFRGQGVRESKRKLVEAIIKLIQSDFDSGRLPAENVADAKVYIEEMAGIKIG